MNYPKLHRYMLIALCSVVAVAGLAALYQFGFLLQATIVAALVLLLWIALILFNLNSNIISLGAVVRESTEQITELLESSAQTQGKPVTTEWEYYVETINTEYTPDEDGKIDNSPGGQEIIQRMLQQYGKEGWDAIAFLPAAPERHFKGYPPNPWLFHVVLKRLAIFGG
jgi:divalent metal cation (Fe/Co/Zn/Cd) transporter